MEDLEIQYKNYSRIDSLYAISEQFGFALITVYNVRDIFHF